MTARDFRSDRRALVGAGVFALVAAIAGGGQAETERLFHGAGVVKGVDAAAGSLTIRHEPIEGLMPGMTMSFHVDPSSLIGAVKKGDAVEFDLAGKTYTIKCLRIVGPQKR